MHIHMYMYVYIYTVRPICGCMHTQAHTHL